MKPWGPVLAALLTACTGLSTGNAPVSIEFVQPPESVLVGDTVALTIRALDRSGDSLPNAAIVLTSLSPDTLGVDSARLAVIGLFADSVTKHTVGLVIASTGNLRSQPLAITVVAP